MSPVTIVVIEKSSTILISRAKNTCLITNHCSSIIWDESVVERMVISDWGISSLLQRTSAALNTF